MQLIAYIYECQLCGHREQVDALRSRGNSMLHRCNGLTIQGPSDMLRSIYEDEKRWTTRA